MAQFRKNQPNNDGDKNKVKSVWKNVGLIAIAIVLAVVTVFVLNLNR
jgi:hypothetical protein